jgi:hypothetical protein
VPVPQVWRFINRLSDHPEMPRSVRVDKSMPVKLT